MLFLSLYKSRLTREFQNVREDFQRVSKFSDLQFPNNKFSFWFAQICYDTAPPPASQLISKVRPGPAINTFPSHQVSYRTLQYHVIL